MKKLIIALLGLILVTGGLFAVTMGPASAGTCTKDPVFETTLACGTIRHYSPDTGLDSHIKIRCDYGDPTTNHFLYEGENSEKYCKDTDRVYVAPGEEIWCNYRYYTAGNYWVNDWKKAKPSPDPNNPGVYMDATGWYKINDLWDDGAGCVKHVD